MDFEVEAKGSDSSSLAALEKSTGDLKSDLGSGGVNLAIGNTTFTAPTQVAIIATVDVTPAINKTYPFTFEVILARMS